MSDPLTHFGGRWRDVKEEAGGEGAELRALKTLSCCLEPAAFPASSPPSTPSRPASLQDAGPNRSFSTQQRLRPPTRSGSRSCGLEDDGLVGPRIDIDCFDAAAVGGTSCFFFCEVFFFFLSYLRVNR